VDENLFTLAHRRRYDNAIYMYIVSQELATVV